MVDRENSTNALRSKWIAIPRSYLGANINDMVRLSKFARSK
ncbi:hypothetical protein [Photorhabdus sp. S14-60]|nr:hypothetical protein [Photorhabdus sp. S14-60]